jgi:hypothetical protein
MTTTISYSSELMQNFKQADIMAPDRQFEALQTASGCTLLFSIGTDGVFYLTQETPGHVTGWTRNDLSSALIAKDFPGAAPPIACKTFDAAQNTGTGSIGLAMVVGNDAGDHLYLSLGNSNPDAPWSCQWTAYPYDNTDHPLSKVVIVNAFISEASDGQYIVVDVLRDPTSAAKLVYRFYIDTAKGQGYAWHAHDVSIDLEEDTYSSCLGRRAGEFVDGLYTIGRVQTLAQFQYQPLYNAFNPKLPAQPSLYTMPGGVLPDALAAARNSDNSSDLYVTGGGALYYLAAGQQESGAKPVLLNTNPVFVGVSCLYASVSNGDVVVWGLNRADQVFYTACPVGQQANPAAWTYPLPILVGVMQMSPYLNLANNANSFVAHTGGNEITKAVKSPQTTLWSFQKITLEAPAGQGATQRFNSYTTRIQLTGDDDQPLANAQAQLASTTRAPVYINNLYTVLDMVAIPVTADSLGCITVVEWVDALAGTRLTISAAGVSSVEINPPDALTGAVITSPDGTQRNLLPPNVPRNDLQQAAAANAQLATVYASFTPGPLSARALSAPRAYASSALAGISVDPGDIFSFLEWATDAVISLVKQAASDAWNFVVQVGDMIYTAVLDCTEQVVAAVQWVYDVVKTAIQDLIDYLQFLFAWGDIARTKQVLHNLSKLYLQDQIAGITTLKQGFDGLIAQAETTINNWAGITGWQGLGAPATAGLAASSTPGSDASAPSSLLSFHLEHNLGSASYTGQPAPNVPSSPITVLLNAIEQEGTVINGVIDQVTALSAQYTSLSLEDILKRLMAIVLDATLSSVQVVVDALCDVITALATAAVDLLDTPIHVPVVSDILNYFGVPDGSVLDMFCWVGALAVTLAYKVANGVAPFPDDATSTVLTTATSFQTVRELYNPQRLMASDRVALAEQADAQRSPVQAAMFASGHLFCGFFTLLTAWIGTMEAAVPYANNPYGTASAALGVLGGVSGGLPGALTPSMPIKNSVIADISTATTGVRVLNKLVMGAGGTKIATDPRKVGAIIDASLVIPGLVCSIWHFYELSGVAACGERSQAIVEETGNLTQYIGRIAYTVAVTSGPDPIPLAIFAGANVCSGGLQFAEAAIST